MWENILIICCNIHETFDSCKANDLYAKAKSPALHLIPSFPMSDKKNKMPIYREIILSNQFMKTQLSRVSSQKLFTKLFLCPFISLLFLEYFSILHIFVLLYSVTDPTWCG